MEENEKHQQVGEVPDVLRDVRDVPLHPGIYMIVLVLLLGLLAGRKLHKEPGKRKGTAELM